MRPLHALAREAPLVPDPAPVADYIARMLLAPRRRALIVLHRSVAVLVALCLAVFQLEALVADICDGDATPSELAAFVGPASDLPRDAVQVATLAADRSSAPAPIGHGAHACHCVHTHGGLLPRLEPVVVRVIDVATAAPAGRPLAASDVARGPLPRPPLA